MRKMWNYVIDLKKGFVPRKEIIYLLSREERESKKVYSGADRKEVYLTVKIITDCTGILV